MGEFSLTCHSYQIPTIPTILPRFRSEYVGECQVLQNFTQINKVTKVAPMPQGDITAKQQRLSGHRWVSGFNFAAGFYAITVDPESRPYTAFYFEGRGYFWYKRIPFGLTGAPSTFAHMTATRMHELLVKKIVELFIDDGNKPRDRCMVQCKNVSATTICALCRMLDTNLEGIWESCAESKVGKRLALRSAGLLRGRVG